MSTRDQLRIAILAHSTIPRGGVAHALAVADALVTLGHDAVVHAPDETGAGFYRRSACKTVSVPAGPAPSSLHDMIEARIAGYVRHFEERENRDFDVYHAQDGISGNALATLKDRGLIRSFARTVHHIDNFSDERIALLQARSIAKADRHFVVSSLWQRALGMGFGVNATIVGNGVDRGLFSSRPHPDDELLRRRLRLGGGPLYLAIGGIEARKNTRHILAAFAQVASLFPSAQLVIAGGKSLLDHDAYRAAFKEDLAALGDIRSRVVLTGPIEQNEMPPLYRIADALVFPSVKEGFGLVAIESIACGTPVVTSRIAPFTEHFREDDVVWCDPESVATIANAMVLVMQPEIRKRLAARANSALAPHSWRRTARAHLPVYESLREVQHA